MRVTVLLLVVAFVFALRLSAAAAIGLEQIAPAEAPAVEQRNFSDGETAHAYEKRRNLRLEAHRRAQMQKRALGIVAVAAPAILIAAVAFSIYRVRNRDTNRATHKKLKDLEARRRAGRPVEEAVDPRRW